MAKLKYLKQIRRADFEPCREWPWILVGAIGGPVGMAVGMFAGTVGEWHGKQIILASPEILDQKWPIKWVPHRCACCRNGWDNVVFVDGTLAPLGGVVVRTDVDYEYEKYNDEEIEEMEEESSR